MKMKRRIFFFCLLILLLCDSYHFFSFPLFVQFFFAIYAFNRMEMNPSCAMCCVVYTAHSPALSSISLSSNARPEPERVSREYSYKKCI